MKLILRISILVSALIALSFSALAKVTLHNVIVSTHLDHVGVTARKKVVTKTYAGKPYISDHYPVYSDLLY